MVIDSSALLAVLLGEEGAAFYANVIEAAADPLMSAVSVLEVTLVIGARKREPGLAALERFLQEGRIRVVAFDGEQLRLAKEAWWNYGKGRHLAALNLGDCCSYALSKAFGKPLLYKGEDFPRTDVRGVEGGVAQ
ncbi:MAG: type II toxin-antitoxin system VapC family toxin [Acidobacteria bacterium]|nr:type II toxin-antitoxin system VapC family toxin [Acidobacteriota bacterium]